MDNYHLFTMLVHCTTNFIGISLNGLLIYLSLHRTPSAIKTYGVMILNGAVTELIACLMDVFVQQRIIPTGLTLAYISYGPCTMISPTVCYIGYTLMLSCYSHGLWSLLLCFSYRYYVLTNPSPRRKSLIIIILLMLIPSVFQFISASFGLSPIEMIIPIVEKRFPSYDLDGLTVTGTKDLRDWRILCTILHMTLPVTPVYVIILVLRSRIVSTLHVADDAMTDKTKRVHRQLLRALTVQSMLPLCVALGVTSYALGQFGILNHPLLEYFTFLSFNLLPVLSPIATIYFVGPYRLFFLKNILRVVPAERQAFDSTSRAPSMKV